jgi:hypothetical protein
MIGAFCTVSIGAIIFAVSFFSIEVVVDFSFVSPQLHKKVVLKIAAIIRLIV